MKIGVELQLAGDAGELLADARALEAAGADSFWVAAEGAEERWMLLAAIAAVTWRARLVVLDDDERSAATLARLSRGRSVTAARDGDAYALPGVEGGRERWVRVPFPEGRAAWKELRAQHEAQGVAGLVLSNDPRLLDLVRNPDVDDDRSDLRIAVG